MVPDIGGVYFGLNVYHLLLQTHMQHTYLGVVVEYLEDEASDLPPVRVAFRYTDAGQAEYRTVNHKDVRVVFIDRE